MKIKLIKYFQEGLRTQVTISQPCKYKQLKDKSIEIRAVLQIKIQLNNIFATIST